MAMGKISIHYPLCGAPPLIPRYLRPQMRHPRLKAPRRYHCWIGAGRTGAARWNPSAPRWRRLDPTTVFSQRPLPMLSLVFVRAFNRPPPHLRPSCPLRRPLLRRSTRLFAPSVQSPCSRLIPQLCITVLMIPRRLNLKKLLRRYLRPPLPTLALAWCASCNLHCRRTGLWMR